jgi:uncharacterized membrane protein
MTTVPASVILAPTHTKEGNTMAANNQLVLAFFESEEPADRAAGALGDWAKANRRVELEAVGVLVKDEQGNVKTHKLGPREGRKGIGIGAVLGVVAAVASGGVTLVEGVALGGAGGGVVGLLFHKRLGLSKDDAARIGRRLDAGHAALGVLVPLHQAAAISAKLEALGGEPEVHDVSADDADLTTTSVSPEA